MYLNYVVKANSIKHEDCSAMIIATVDEVGEEIDKQVFKNYLDFQGFTSQKTGIIQKAL